MNWTAGMFVAVAGFMAGEVLFGFFIRWLALVAEAWSQASSAGVEKRRWGHLFLTVACQSLFHSAPWLALALAIFAWHVHSEAWADWLFWGAGASMLVMVIVSITAAHRIFKRKGEGNAA